MTPEKYADRLAALLNEMTQERVQFDLYDNSIQLEGGDYVVCMAPTVEDVWRVELA